MIDALASALKRSSVGVQKWAEKWWGDVSPDIGSDIVVALVLAGMTGAFLPMYIVMFAFTFFAASSPVVHVAMNAVFLVSLVVGMRICARMDGCGKYRFILLIMSAVIGLLLSLVPLGFCGPGWIHKEEWATVGQKGKETYFMTSIWNIGMSILPCVSAYLVVSENRADWSRFTPEIKQILRQGKPSAKSPDLLPTPDPGE